MATATVSVDVFGYVRGLLASRGITDYYMDLYRWAIPAGRTRHNTGGERALYYLLPQSLPAGMVLISDTWALQVGSQWQAAGIGQIQEFTGQLSLRLPAGVSVEELTFLRVRER